MTSSQYDSRADFQGAGLSQSDIAPIPIGAITRGGQHVTHRRPQSVHSITSSQSGDPAKVIEAR